jgi:hypothetical protein
MLLVARMGNSESTAYQFKALSVSPHKPIATLGDGSQIHSVYKPVIVPAKQQQTTRKNTVVPDSLDKQIIYKQIAPVETLQNAIPHRKQMIQKQYGRKSVPTLEYLENKLHKNITVNGDYTDKMKKFAENKDIQNGYSVVRQGNKPYVVSPEPKVYWFNGKTTNDDSKNLDVEQLEAELYKSIGIDPLPDDETEQDETEEEEEESNYVQTFVSDDDDTDTELES